MKISTRNWALYRSLNVKILNTEKSTFLKPESRKMFRPILPNVPLAGGVMTELPDTKQPSAPSVPVALVRGLAGSLTDVLSAALAAHNVAAAVVKEAERGMS